MPRVPVNRPLAIARCAYQGRDFPNAARWASFAIDDNPALVPAWSLRGRARRDAGNPDAAWNDFTRALDLDPACVPARSSRANLALDAGLPADALTDFERALADRRHGSEDYLRLRTWLCRTQLHDQRAASRDLRTWLRSSPCASSWTWALAETLWRAKRPEDLMSEAKSDAEKCEAGFWAGTRLLLDHDRPAALRAFRSAVATGMWKFTEFRSAKAVIDRIGA